MLLEFIIVACIYLGMLLSTSLVVAGLYTALRAKALLRPMYTRDYNPETISSLKGDLIIGTLMVIVGVAFGLWIMI